MTRQLLYTIFLFIIIFAITYANKPLFLYNSDGSLKEFGIGFQNKTIMPLWLYSIVLGILSYMAILYYDMCCI